MRNCWNISLFRLRTRAVRVRKERIPLQDYEMFTPATLVYPRFGSWAHLSRTCCCCLFCHIPLWLSMTVIRRAKRKKWNVRAGRQPGAITYARTFSQTAPCVLCFHFIPLDVILLLRRKTIKEIRVKIWKVDSKVSERCRGNQRKTHNSPVPPPCSSHSAACQHFILRESTNLAKKFNSLRTS